MAGAMAVTTFDVIVVGYGPAGEAAAGRWPTAAATLAVSSALSWLV